MQQPRNNFLLHLHGCGVAALPFAVIRRASGHCKGFVVCHTACSSSAFVTAAPVSNRSTSFIRSSLRFIPPRSYQINLLQGMAFTQLVTQSFSNCAATCHFAKPTLNTHWVPFRFVRRYFISVLLCPLAAHYFARRLSPLRLRSACICTAHSLRPFRLQLLSFTCIVQPPPYTS
jgi:hypothetical protein